MRRCSRFILMVAAIFSLTACNSQQPVSPAPTDDLGYDAAHGGGHDDHHGHAHSHEALGPHEGHVIELGDEEYHVEWLHDDESGLVTVYILDSAMKAEVPIEARTLTVEYTVGKEQHPHELTAVESEGSDGTKTARFEVTSKSLISALKMAGQGVDATIAIEIDGKPFTAKFEHGSH